MSEPEHANRILDQFTRQAVPFSTAAPIRNEEALQRIVRIANAGADDSVLDVDVGDAEPRALDVCRVALHALGQRAHLLRL